MNLEKTVVCAGRALDANDQPIGTPCGKRYHDACMCCGGWCGTAGQHGSQQRQEHNDRHCRDIEKSLKGAKS